ncbi:hypothetical protein SDC9_114853 [bioreactor metagenome]|uniref:Uncharacterized protein n=1 Tax=bioreactor metagenome TaxID=1076179 RepID=A0A645BS65_9ZZZZ
MEISNEQLKKFRDLKIRRSDLSEGGKIELFNVAPEQNKPVPIFPEHVITLLNRFKTQEISKARLLEWVNTVMFTDLFDYAEEYQNSIASVFSELEEIDEEGKDLTPEKFDLLLTALQNNTEA